ncbi:MAG: hypothetical protein HKL99_10885 [Burkholderiales bacterium]|nr:hypothetical protein [Burkholderiales bacterium]
MADLSDVDLLTLACEPEFLDGCTALELDLIWRLEAAVHATQSARDQAAQLLDALWQAACCPDVRSGRA